MSKHTTGTTTQTSVNAYTDMLSLPMSDLEKVSILIENTGGANTIKYKILGYLYDDGGSLEDEVKAEATLAHSTQDAIIKITDPYARIKLQIASNVGDSHSTVQVDHIGTGNG